MAALRALMQAHLASPLVMEVLHRVGQVQGAAFDAQLLQRTVQQLARRPGEGATTQVLDITGLFAHQHDACIGRTFAEHGLGRRFPQRALPADGGLLAQRLQAAIVRSGIGCIVRPGGNTSLRCLCRSIMHLLHATRCVAYKPRQQLCFGKMFPVTGGHFLLHHPRVEPGRIEDAGVIGLPQRLTGIFGGGIVAVAAIAEGEGTAIPADTARGCQDRPAHTGKTAGEKRRDAVDDVVIGFEPGDERVGLAGHLPEAHEGLHLVRVAAHRLRQRHQPQHIGVGRIGQHRAFAMRDAPQQAVQQRQPLRIAMA